MTRKNLRHKRNWGHSSRVPHCRRGLSPICILLTAITPEPESGLHLMLRRIDGMVCCNQRKISPQAHRTTIWQLCIFKGLEYKDAKVMEVNTKAFPFLSLWTEVKRHWYVPGKEVEKVCTHRSRVCWKTNGRNLLFVLGGEICYHNDFGCYWTLQSLTFDRHQLHSNPVTTCHHDCTARNTTHMAVCTSVWFLSVTLK